MRRVTFSKLIAACLATILASSPGEGQQRSVPGARGQPPRPTLERLLRQHYPGWTVQLGDRFCGPRARSSVNGDFNGDQILDHAVRITRGNRGQIVAFLSRDRSFSPMVLQDESRAEIMNSALGLERRGTHHSVSFNLDQGERTITLAHDAPTGGTCEASSFIYIIRGRGFARAFTSD